MDTNQATILTAWATIGQAIAAVVMIGLVGWTAYLARKQTENTRIQNQNMSLQTERMQTPINLNLYEKRFKIYTALVILLNSVLDVKLPERGEARERFNEDVLSCLKKFWRDSTERVFLLDDNLNQYINTVEKKIKEYLSDINKTFIPIDDQEYVLWRINAQKEQLKILSICNEPSEKFRECLDFRKI